MAYRTIRSMRRGLGIGVRRETGDFPDMLLETWERFAAFPHPEGVLRASLAALVATRAHTPCQGAHPMEGR